MPLTVHAGEPRAQSSTKCRWNRSLRPENPRPRLGFSLSYENVGEVPKQLALRTVFKQMFSVMSSHLLLRSALLALSAMLLCLPLSAQADWELEKDEAGIKVYTRKVEGQALKSFRAETTIAATPQALVNTLTDLSRASEWMDRCAQSRVIERYDDNSYLGYTLVDVPWPLQARDLVTRVHIRRQADRIVIEMKNAPNDYPKQQDVVRMPQYEGQWILIPQSDGRTQVINQGATSPGGSIPDWLANTEVVESPYKTMANLRARMEQ